jgi:prolyl-tRNA editing enzyme YbaK/EbsC (Cys-tRNA(Pro) deacylase)
VRTYLEGEWKRLTFANADEILAVTGYVQGAVNPLCLPDDVPVLFDQAIGRCRHVNISTGDTMFGLEMDANDLIRLARAQLVRIVECGK